MQRALERAAAPVFRKQGKPPMPRRPCAQTSGGQGGGCGAARGTRISMHFCSLISTERDGL